MKRIDYWGLVLEGTVIVASILLAFIIDAWYQGRQETQEIERLFASLLVETKQNVERIERDLQYRLAVLKSVDELFALSASGAVIDLEDLDGKLGDLVWNGVLPTRWGALESLVSGGRLQLIENIELREALAAMHGQRQELQITIDF